MQPTVPETQGFILYENFYENLDVDAFVKELESMGIKDLLAIYQQIYDHYLAAKNE